MLNNIRIDLANGGLGCKDKKAFDDLTRLITYISNSQVKKENAIKRTNKNISALNQLSKKRYCFLKLDDSSCLPVIQFIWFKEKGVTII